MRFLHWPRRLLAPVRHETTFHGTTPTPTPFAFTSASRGVLDSVLATLTTPTQRASFAAAYEATAHLFATAPRMCPSHDMRHMDRVLVNATRACDAWETAVTEIGPQHDASLGAYSTDVSFNDDASANVSAPAVNYCGPRLRPLSSRVRDTRFGLLDTGIVRESVMLASLLHDVDDRKFFGSDAAIDAARAHAAPSKTTSTTRQHQEEPKGLWELYPNAMRILRDTQSRRWMAERCGTVLQMIDAVSASRNKNRIPTVVALSGAAGARSMAEWFLIPRYADRLESVGFVGIARSYQYGKTTGRPLWTRDTPRPRTEAELWLDVATPERHAAYGGHSASLVDYVLDSAIHVSRECPIRNRFVRAEAARRQAALVQFVLDFGRGGSVSVMDLEYLADIVFSLDALDPFNERVLHPSRSMQEVFSEHRIR